MTCHRCQGCLCWNFEEWYCANCGYRLNPPMSDPLPNEPINRPVMPGICELCQEHKAMRGKRCCRRCYLHEGLHSSRIKEGMARARG